MTEANITLTLEEAFAYSGGTTALGADGVTILTGGNLGLDYYPLWDNAYRGTLNGKIYDHYLKREIGFETIELFQQRVRSYMNDRMPYFNELYKTQLDLVDPLRTVDLTTIAHSIANQNATTASNSDAVSTNKSGSRSVQSDFPQNMLSGDSDYASAGADVNGTVSVESEGSDSGSSETTGEQDSDSNVSGYQGLPGDIIQSYRNAILNIDFMVITMLEPMFLQVLQTGDSYTNNRLGMFL